jgi:transposase
MEVRQTVPVKLVVPDERRDDLHESARQFLHCANRAAEFCWDNDSYTNCITANSTARDALYEELREETELTANLVQEAIRRAVQATKGCAERWKQGKRVSQPEFTSWSTVYDKRSATFHRNNVSFSTVNGRVECEFELPADSPTPYERYVLSDEYEFRASTLQYDKATDEFYFHITTRKYDDDESEASADTGHQTVLGIDLGVNSLAVASTGTF